jgi:hypothetical protein
MKNTKKIGLGLLGLLVVLIILPFFIPTATYIKQAEKIASNAIGVSVRIDQASVSLLPTPRLRVSDIVIGDQSDGLVAELVIIPTLSSLFSSQKVIDVALDDVVIKQSALAIFSHLMQTSKEDELPAAVVLRNLSVKGLHISMPDAKLPLINMEVSLKDNQLDKAKLYTQGEELQATLTPQNKGHHVLLNIKNWQLPIESQLTIDSGEADMMLIGSRLSINNYSLHMYDGEVTGKAALSWSKAWVMDGDVSVKKLALNKPSRLISPKAYLSGALNGSGGFSAKSSDVTHLLDQLKVNFQFTVNDGVLHGVDLVKVASLLIKQKVGGGETQFDRFSGHLNVAGKQYKLNKLDISSGLLAANGHVKVSPQKTLDGQVEVEVKKSVGLVAVPLNISGSVDNPVVLPSKAAVAGAVAGTAVLGPGVGTSLGIKASKGLEKLKEGLFGGDDE